MLDNAFVAFLREKEGCYKIVNKKSESVSILLLAVEKIRK